MLYVAIGTLWVVSIICMMFLAAYVYRLTRRQLTEGSDSYFWTVSRILIVLCLGLSTFYFGIANRIESLPKLVAYRLQIQEIPLWSAEAWVSLSMVFGVCGILFALTDTLKNDFGIGTGATWGVRSFDVPLLPLKIPYALTFANAYSHGRDDEEASTSYFSQAEQFWALANVLVGLFTGCLLFVGLQTVSQLNFVQALGIQNDLGSNIAFGERIRPTATPTANINGLIDGSANNEQEAIGAVDSSADAQVTTNSQEQSATNPVQDDGQPAPEQLAAANLPAATDSSQAEVATSTAPDANLPAPDNPSREVASPEGASPEGASPETSLPEQVPSAQPTSLVVINEPLGVNARTGPGTDFGVITVLQAGTRHLLLKSSDDGQWLNIQMPSGADGWVASWVVDVTP